MKPSLRVLFLAAEADPFVKVGGLGDVAGSLPLALRSLSPPAVFPPLNGSDRMEEMEMDVRLVIPFHGAIQRQAYPLRTAASFSVYHQDGPIPGEALTMDWEGMPVYMISGSPIPPDAPVYTPNELQEGKKFTFFSLAALELARSLNWAPHIVHANDWHTAPAIHSLRLDRKRGSFFYNTATIIGVHNLPFLGVGTGPALAAFGLPPARKSSLPKWAQELPLPLGLWAADHIVTVSPTYAQEILTPEFSSGLDEFLQGQADSITGILNGLDYERWDPQTDSALAANYSRENLDARKANKKALQQELGLEVDESRLMFAMISRMDYQKGIDLIPGALRRLADKPWQAVFLGTGDPALESAVRDLEGEFPDRFRAAIRFDAALSRRIYAGADSLLIPSRYEPCGLAQMIAMRYGCVPIARATGGLSDTILDYSRSDDSTGFLFTNPSDQALAGALERALKVWSGPAEWQALQRRGMQMDFSWERSARQYLELYLTLVEQRNQITHRREA